MELTTEKIPTYALPALVNGDDDSLTQEDVENITSWMKRAGIKQVIAPTDEEYQPYFSYYPAFGKATDVVDCKCVLEW